MKASTATIRVVIAGGGFAGLYPPKEFERILAGRPEIEVTLISLELNRENRSTETLSFAQR